MVDLELNGSLSANSPVYSRSFSSEADAVQPRSNLNTFHLRRGTVPHIPYERPNDYGEPVPFQLLPAIPAPTDVFSRWDWLKSSATPIKSGDSTKRTDTFADNNMYSHLSATTGEASDARLLKSASGISDEGLDPDSGSVSFPGSLWELSHMNSLASIFSNASESLPMSWVADKDTCASRVQGTNEQGEFHTDTFSDTSLTNRRTSSLYNNSAFPRSSLPAALLQEIRLTEKEIKSGPRQLTLAHSYESLDNREGNDKRASLQHLGTVLTPRQQPITTNYTNKNKSSSFFSSLFEDWPFDEVSTIAALKSPQENSDTDPLSCFHRYQESHASDTFRKVQSIAEKSCCAPNSTQLLPGVIVNDGQGLDRVSIDTARPISRRFTVSGALPYQRTTLNTAVSHFSPYTFDNNTPPVGGEQLKENPDGLLRTTEAFVDPAEHAALSLFPSSQEKTLLKKCNAIPPSEMTLSLLKNIPRGVNGELLSVGSMYHATGTCRPCLFLNNPVKTCQNGIRCLFCHYYHPPKHRTRVSKKKRLKAKRREEAKLLCGEAHTKEVCTLDTSCCRYIDPTSFPLLILNESSNLP